ncbi:hypothetical protein ALC62_01391 [Cyphomyrmex costatus]|uniref:Mos1 transposase HTH domain-containing protein n=1 Tax=Cyphomyrmex costatus TaxID=456900 RepID=A0A195D3Z7_9HYME|nr:hypothetical protein ALC62_01391 [Cyphomyrmex costatus]
MIFIQNFSSIGPLHFISYSGLSDATFVFFKTMEKSEFRVLIKNCFLMGKNTVQAKQWLDMCYSDSAPLETTVKRWYADFKRGRKNANDAERSGRSNSTKVESLKSL